MTEYKIVEWHHQYDRHEFVLDTNSHPGVGDGQGSHFGYFHSLACSGEISCHVVSFFMERPRE